MEICRTPVKNQDPALLDKVTYLIQTDHQMLLSMEILQTLVEPQIQQQRKSLKVCTLKVHTFKVIKIHSS